MTLRVRAQMPGDDTPPPRARGWQVAVLGLLGVMGWVAVQTLVDSMRPDGYAARYMTGPWIYPTEQVVTWLGVMAVEGALACLVLAARVKASLVARGFVLSGLMFLVLVMFVPLAMHAGTPFLGHLIWLFFGSIWLFLVSVARAIINGRNR